LPSPRTNATDRPRRPSIACCPPAARIGIVGYPIRRHRPVIGAGSGALPCRGRNGKDVVALQRERQLTSSAQGAVQVFDRSPVCTHALATYLGLPVSAALASELERIAAERIYETRVFFVRNLGFCEPTAARRISFQDSLEFEKVHELSYRAYGFELIDIPADELADRVDAVEGGIGGNPG
jgi:predicted ATPase